MELLNFFDENGRSDIAKEAMKFYRDNKDKVITPGVIEFIRSLNLTEPLKQHKPSEIRDKLSKIKK
jgi:hypothetical protein